MKKKKNKTLGDLEKKKKTKFQKVEQKKSTNPPSQIVSSFLKLLIWGSLSFIVIVGIYNLVVPRPPQIIEERIVLDISPVEGDTAKAFARSFAKEYFTFTTDRVEYLERLEPFLVKSSFVKTDFRRVESEVLDALVWSVEKLDPGHADIVVRLEYQTINYIDLIEVYNVNGDTTYEPDIQKNIVFLNVPIAYKDGMYGVEDYVNIIENQNLKMFEYAPEIYSGTSASKDVSDKVKIMLENFFEVYTSGNSVNISYYLGAKSDLKLQGIEGFKYDSIDNLRVFKEDKNSYKAMVTVMYEENNIGTLFPSVYLIDVKKTDNQYYITDIETRRNEF